MSAAVAEAPVASAALQNTDAEKSKGASGGGVRGENGTAVSSEKSRMAAAPAALTASAAPVTDNQPKKRRVVEDDDDDDDVTPSRPSKPATAEGRSGGNRAKVSSNARGSGGGGGGKSEGGASGPVRNGSLSSKAPDDRQRSRDRKPATSGGGGGKTIPSLTSLKGSSAPSGGSSSAKGREGDSNDRPVSTVLKMKTANKAKTAAAPTATSSGSTNGSKNGPALKKEASFKIPRREGTPPRPAIPAVSGSSPSSSSSKTTKPKSSSSSSSPRPGSSSTSGGSQRRDEERRSRDADDDDFEKKPGVLKPKKRPSDDGRGDFQSSSNDTARRKRKLEDESRERAREEARKKKRREEKLHGSKSSSSAAAAPKPKGKVESKPRRASTGSASSGKARGKAPPPAREQKNRKFKEMTRAERIEQAMKVYKWWEEPAHENGRQWESMEHNGAYFAPEYKPHGVKLKYDGADVYLNPQQEEVATFYASMPLDGPQLAEQGEVFNKNFFEDFKTVLGKGHKIKNFNLLDFSAIRAHLETAKQIKRAATDGEKATAKSVKEELTHKYSYAIVDGHLEKVGNYNVEPPALFRGRGKHPKTGKLKARVMPSDIALNCAESVCVPRCGVPGYSWQMVQHDPSVTWLSKWDGVLAGTKYMMLAASSSFKGKSDMAKYDKAMKLKGFIEKIRADYTKKLSSSDKRTKQIATAVWIIDKLALRVGGEKGEDEADTVGCCSLRVEHLTIRDLTSAAGDTTHEIDLEFLGKDSMRFKQTIDFDKYGAIGLRVFKNLQQFVKSKRQSEEVFDYLDPSVLNQHLQSLMPGLTAKVFRTYNASDTLQRQLPEADALAGLSVAEKVALYNGANREVAILCNHQKTVSNAQKDGLEKMHDHLAMLKKQKQELKEMLALVKKGKGSRVQLKSSDKSMEDRAIKAIEKAKAQKAKATTDEEKVAATKAHEAANDLKKAMTRSKQETMHLFAKVPNEESLVGRIKVWTEKIKKREIDIRDRDDNKEVSLSTSKINYMDPRVSVAWCKRHEVPVEKVFARTLRDKFVWAMNVAPNWKFAYETLLESKSQAVGSKPTTITATKKKTPTKISKTATATTATAVPKTTAPKASPKASVGAQSSSLKNGKGKEKTKEESEEEDESSEEEESGSDGDDDDDDGDGSEESSDEDDSEEGSEDDEDDDDDDDDDDDIVPTKKRRKSSASSSRSAKKPRRKAAGDDDDESEEGGDDSDFSP